MAPTQERGCRRLRPVWERGDQGRGPWKNDFATSQCKNHENKMCVFIFCLQDNTTLFYLNLNRTPRSCSRLSRNSIAGIQQNPQAETSSGTWPELATGRFAESAFPFQGMETSRKPKSSTSKELGLSKKNVNERVKKLWQKIYMLD